MKNDNLLLAGIIGALSTVPAEIVTQILVFLGIGKNSIYSISSMVITITRPSIIMGMLISASVGGFCAGLLYYLLVKLGSDHIVIKSVSVSFLLWIALEVFFTMFIEGKYIAVRPVSDYYVHFAGALVFGFTEGILLKKYLFHKNFT